MANYFTMVSFSIKPTPAEQSLLLDEALTDG